MCARDRQSTSTAHALALLPLGILVIDWPATIAIAITTNYYYITTTTTARTRVTKFGPNQNCKLKENLSLECRMPTELSMLSAPCMRMKKGLGWLFAAVETKSANAPPSGQDNMKSQFLKQQVQLSCTVWYCLILCSCTMYVEVMAWGLLLSAWVGRWALAWQSGSRNLWPKPQEYQESHRIESYRIIHSLIG